MKADPQRSEDWIRARLGKITSTRFQVALFGGPEAKNTLIDRLRRELDDPESVLEDERRDAPNLEFGRRFEPALLARYEIARGVEIERTGLIVDPDMPFLAASPDGILPDRVIEGKCRVEVARHADTLLRMAPDDEYIGQVQGQMMVARRDLCDFVSYCPGWPDIATRLVIVAVEIDRELVAELRRNCAEIWSKVQDGTRFDVSGSFFKSAEVPTFF